MRGETCLTFSNCSQPWGNLWPIEGETESSVNPCWWTADRRLVLVTCRGPHQVRISIYHQQLHLHGQNTLLLVKDTKRPKEVPCQTQHTCETWRRLCKHKADHHFRRQSTNTCTFKNNYKKKLLSAPCVNWWGFSGLKVPLGALQEASGNMNVSTKCLCFQQHTHELVISRPQATLMVFTDGSLLMDYKK